MNSIHKILPATYPRLLKEISGLPPHLYIRGEIPDDTHTFLTVVGSRKHTEYGKVVVQKLVESLRGLPIVIVSGLAFGIDAIAHKAAIDTGLKTIAIPGSGLSPDFLYPSTNRNLAEQILESGGALISPFESEKAGASWMFPVRNRIMAGMSHATLIIEAEIKSGTLITSKHATEFNRNVFAVPGSIFSKQSEGPHMLIRLGATPITCSKDLIEALGFKTDTPNATRDYSHLSEDELKIIELLETPLSRDELFEKLDMDTAKINSLISLLEIKGLMEEKLGAFHKV